MSRTALPAADVLARMRRDGGVVLEDVLVLRRHVWPRGGQSRADLDALLQVDAGLSIRCAEWDDFLVEAIVAHLVEAPQPPGVVGEAEAAWLLDHAAPEGVLERPVLLEAVLRVTERAACAPLALSQLARRTVVRAALEGDAALLDDERAARGSLRDPAVALMRRALLASRSLEAEEAEAVMRLDRETAGNVPAWSSLYAVTMLAALMGEAGWTMPERHVLAWLEAELNAMTVAAAPGRPTDRLRLSLATRGDGLRERAEALHGPFFMPPVGQVTASDAILRHIEDGRAGPSLPVLAVLARALVPDLPRRLAKALATV